MIDQDKLLNLINNEKNPDILYFLLNQYLKEYDFIIEQLEEKSYLRYELKNDNLIRIELDENLNSINYSIYEDVSIIRLKNEINDEILGSFFKFQ
jgi:hypothetical protein